jgi:hypothetical protein
MNKKTIVIIIIVVLLAGALGWFLILRKNPVQPGEETGNENEIAGQDKTYTVVPSEENKENNVYTDSQYKFSFEYPKDFTATKFREGEEGDTILVQKQGSKDGFQIFITPFDEPGPLTEERVKQDLPDLKMENSEQRVLKNGVPALIFFSEETSLGKTREIWFIHPVRNPDSNGASNYYLYQVSTYKELDSLVAAIISTWKFAN